VKCDPALVSGTCTTCPSTAGKTVYCNLSTYKCVYGVKPPADAGPG
jgi:hypothetical protein